MFTNEQINQNHILMINSFKKLVAEVTNAISNELRICDKIDPRGVMISNGNIIFATGKRLDGYTIKKFFEAFESTMDSVNREVVEELVMHLQMDAMRFPSILNGINSGICSQLALEKMWHRYQMLYQATKYKAIKVNMVCVVPKTEFYQIPFTIDRAESFCHEFFNMNYEEYVQTLYSMANKGSLRDAYEDRRRVVRRNEAAKMNERRKKQMNVATSKPNDWLKQGRIKAPISQRKNG